MPIAGRVYYKTDPTEIFKFYQECNSCYPVPQGQQITINGIVAASTNEDSQTDIAGVYSVSAPLGKHTIQVSNPVRQQLFGSHSVKFDGKTGYLQAQAIGFNQSWMLSGWIKPDSEADASQEQTVLDLGNVLLVLKDNKRLEIKKNASTLLTSTVQLVQGQNQGSFTFFTLVYDNDGKKLGLYVDNTYDEAPAGNNLTHPGLTVGANKQPSGLSNFFQGNLDQLEYRDKLYIKMKDNNNEPADYQELLNQLKEGKLISSESPAVQSNTDGLRWSHRFEHTTGTRAVGYDIDNGSFHVFDLHGGVTWDAADAAYTREFQYEYEASNSQWNPEGDAYELNITQAITGLNFENQTRFGFVGNIIVPCGHSAGEWTGKITRTDVVDPKFEKDIPKDYFNNENTLFAIGDLLPGSYRVTLSNGPIEIQSSVIDITTGWASYDFEYRNPLKISTKLYKADLDNLNNKGEELTPICNNSNYELIAGEQYRVEVSAYEVYGDGTDIEANRCYVGGATVNVGGDAATFAQGKYNTFIGDNPSTEIVEVGETGKVIIPFIANTPNFQGDYTRKLSVSVTHDNRNQQAEITSYNTGSRQEEKNFTIKSPRVISILHDPPGGSSFAYLEKGHEITYTKGFEAGFNQEFSIAGEVGINTDNYAGGGFGAIFVQKTNEVNTGLTIGAIQEAHFKKINNQVESVSFNRTIETSSGSDVVGLDADVYLGMGQVIHLGKGRTLSIEGCSVKFEDNVEVIKNEVESMFAYTHQDIKDVLIPQLEIAIKSESDPNEKMSLQQQVREWSNILKNNANNVRNIANHDNWGAEHTLDNDPLPGESDANNVGDDALLNGEISFSGGLKVTYDLAMSDEVFDGTENGGGAGLVQEFESSITVFGVEIGIEESFKMLGFRNNNESTSETNSATMGFTLEDSDNGDHFNVAVKKDPVYLTPIFRTLAGQSMCPYEAGTQPREGVEISVDGAEDVHALYGEEAVYHVTLRNTQVGVDATPKRYYITVNRGEVPDGAIVRYNGDPMGPGLPISFEAGEIEKNGVITISHPDWAQGGQLDYENIPILFYSGCERDGRLYSSYHIDELKETNCGTLPYRSMYINNDGSIDKAKKVEYDRLVQKWQNCTNHTKMVDEVQLSAHFRAPCITEIQLKQPGNGWIVNATSNNQLELVFAIPGLTSNATPNGLTKLHIERYDKNSPTKPLILKTLSVEQLKALVEADGNVHYKWNVSGLSDGDYKIRITPQCGNDIDMESWRKQNPTEWLEGNIYRTIPVITSVTPGDGGVLGENKTVTITYDRPIQYTGVSSANISLRGVLAGAEYVPKSGVFHPGVRIDIPHQEAFNAEENPHAYTVEFWVKRKEASFPGWPVLVAKGNEKRQFRVDINEIGQIGNAYSNTVASIPADTWTHVAVIHDGENDLKILLDGIDQPLDKSFSNNTKDRTYRQTNGPINIGADSFEGQLDEIRIWNIARDPAQILTYKNKRLLGNEEGLIGYYVMDDIALDGEAIRDFTGLAQGTTATNLTFAMKDGAPIEQGEIVQDVPVDVVRAGTREIVIQPKSNIPTWIYEGQELTAFIKDRAIRGEYGNPAKGKTWRFRVNTNHITWAQTSKTMYLDRNRTNPVTFSMALLNKNNQRIKYKLLGQGWPEWLSVNSLEKDRLYTLDGTFSDTPVREDISFSIGTNLTQDEDIVVQAEIQDDNGNPIAYESFILDIIIPNANKSHLLKEMQVWAQVEINGEISDDPNDQLSALIGEEVRGFNQVETIDGKSLIRMTVVSPRELQESQVDFSVWDASQNKRYYSPKHPFTEGNYGSKENPIKLIFKGEQGEEGQAATGASYTLEQNVPNPMYSRTAITYTLPVDEERVILEIWDIKGGATPLRTLVSTAQKAGNYTVEWDGTTDGGNKLPPGVYTYTLKTSGKVLTNRIIIQ